jgi:SAM-dependent methyltransferase
MSRGSSQGGLLAHRAHLSKIGPYEARLAQAKPITKAADSDLARLYQTRFSAADRAAKERVWAILCEDFFSRFIGPNDRVLELAAGYCEFINHIRCAEKFAYDENPDTARYAARDVRLVLGDCRDMSVLPSEYFDVVFASNFFEHLESKHDLDLVLQEARERLRPGGRLLVLQPNIRYLGGRYWDFYDHATPLTHLSLREGLIKNGFEVQLMIPKFLPYTFKSRFPTMGWLVRLYLRLPPAQWLFGKQMFAVAIRPKE